ncbi:extracellular solute-binding protein [Synechococcales cyanobacterium C]|uniref:Extracellular solute-binding protein n=1 Tax=Petrachloros mirabilis ULC683 TaxID=2781853 RepID=A0A8K1ZXB5_9CYAN|nr:extracellular solute-binding protein [Petrachloros mirabilis ULC683]
MKPKQLALGLATLAVTWGVTLVGVVSAQTLTLYSGRNEALIGPLIEKAKAELGLDIQVRYGDTAELAATILEEGQNSPADIYFGQDAGALGALQKAGRAVVLPASILEKVDERFRSPQGQWIGISGRSRVLDYNTNRVQARDLPRSVWELTTPKWRGRVAWAPTNGSFQSFVTAMRMIEGEERTREWLTAMKNNGAVVYRNNTTIVEALGRGEIDIGLVNNYYLARFKREDPNFPVAHHFTRGDSGSMINVAGVAILDTADSLEEAQAFVEFLLSPESQRFFAEETTEYPLVVGIPHPPEQVPIDEINPPRIDLSNLADLDGTLSLLQEVGVL